MCIRDRACYSGDELSGTLLMRVSLQYEYCDGYQLYLYLQRRMRLLDVLGKHGNFISFITILRLYKPDVLLDEYLFVQYRCV